MEMHPGSKDEDIDLEDTGIEMAEDSEIKPIHERESLMGRGTVKRRSCIHSACRIVMGIVATGIFVFMLIQLWQNYGDQIKSRVLSPVVVGAGKFDEKGHQGKSFLLNFHKWENSTLHVNASRPENDLLQVTLDEPQAWSYKWDKNCIIIDLQSKTGVNIVLWSV